jgi:tRNA (cmo5U34)-methyltransferase
MAKDSIHETVAESAESYDALIEKIIPHYHLQQNLLLTLVSLDQQEKMRVLDLGIGTGALSETILNHFPDSTVHGMDRTKGMLGECDKRLKRFGDRVTLEEAEITEWNGNGEYELVVAGLSLHHLTQEEKQKNYHHINKSLKKGGSFFLLDIVLGESEKLTNFYVERWANFMSQNNFNHQAVIDDYYDADIPASVTDHFEWLQKAGFSVVDCPWREYNFVILHAQK